jgi:hypothetical protein
MAFWIVPPEKLMEEVRQAGLDAHSGLRGIGYAARMLLPLLMTCDTLDFSHTIGSVNSPWNAIFVYERCPHGLGFTEKAYERLHELMPAVLEHVGSCECEDGCPCCVGKPLRQYAVWNVERGEAAIPSKASALMVLKGLLGDCSNLEAPDAEALTDSEAGGELRLERALRRRLERMREPRVFHPIEPLPATGYPDGEKPESLPQPDVARRAERRRGFERELRKRIAGHAPDERLKPDAGKPRRPAGMTTPGGSKPPTHFPGRPAVPHEKAPTPETSAEDSPIEPGDSLAARARRLRKKRAEEDGQA